MAKQSKEVINICKTCGFTVLAKGEHRCGNCKREYNTPRDQRRKAGLCLMCGKPQGSRSKWLCDEHQESETLRIMRKQFQGYSVEKLEGLRDKYHRLIAEIDEVLSIKNFDPNDLGRVPNESK